jgi:hypothetical protein
VESDKVKLKEAEGRTVEGKRLRFWSQDTKFLLSGRNKFKRAIV